jgi:DNA-binding XRE family transcriptional regulator
MQTDKTGHWPAGLCASPGERFRWLRCSYSECGTKRPITQKTLGQMAELSETTVQGIEEDTLVTASYRIRLCRALGIGQKLDILNASGSEWLKFVQKLGLKSKPITMPKKANAHPKKGLP